MLYLSNSNARRKANINAKKFDQLMQDIEKDVGRRTKNSKNLDIWTNKLGSYINTNPFTTGGVKHAEMVGLLENIMSEAKFKGLARGGTAELVKGVISENTMHYVTRMGDDMKNNLRKIAVDAYNQNMNPHQIAEKLQDEVQGLSKTRAKAIARTETMRANNLSNYVNAKLNMGAKSYKVISASDCCPRCDLIYKNGSVWFDIDDLTHFPPLHPNCRCVVVFSTKTAYENNRGLYKDLHNEYPLNKNINNKTLTDISSYVGNNSSPINYALESKGLNKYSKRDYDIGQNINNNILNNGHKLSKDTTLWRGQDDLYINNPEIGKEYSWNRLLSTSFSREVANDFKREGWLIEIQAPKNTKGLYVENLSPNSLEHEYILPINTRYKILKIFNKDKYIKIQIIQ